MMLLTKTQMGLMLIDLQHKFIEATILDLLKGRMFLDLLQHSRSEMLLLEYFVV